MKKWTWGPIITVLGLFLPLFLHSEQLSIPQGVLVASGINAEFIAKFSLFIGVLLLWTVIWGKILKIVFRLPVIAGQIIAGILLGPSGVNIAGIDWTVAAQDGWDCANMAMFIRDMETMQRIVRGIYENAFRLRIKRIVLTE